MEEMIHRARGSTRPVTFTILIGDTAQDLTGCTVTVYLLDAQYWKGRDYDTPGSRFNYRTVPTGSLKVDGASCTIAADQSADTGEATWTPGATDLDTAGMYWFQPWVVFSDASEDGPEPILFEVYESLESL